MQEDAKDNLTSLTLLQDLENNTPGSWDRFVRLYAPLIYGWVRHHGVQPNDAGDIRQEVFQVILKKIGDFQTDHPGPGGFRSWLWGITRITLIAHCRRESRQTPGTGGSSAQIRLNQLTEQEDEPDSIGENSAQQVILQSALEILKGETNSETWQAFYRMAMKGESAEAIASDFGKSPKTIRQAKYRLTVKLKQMLEDDIQFTLE